MLLVMRKRHAGQCMHLGFCCIYSLLNRYGEQKYTILLILTQGHIDDLRDTINAIVEVSTSPLSILFVGLGPQSDLVTRTMQYLDSDGKVLRSTDGTPAKRDNVHYIPFSDFIGMDDHELAKKVLEEVTH
jgi:hypothetical protein